MNDLSQGLQTSFSEDHISYNKIVGGPDISRNVRDMLH